MPKIENNNGNGENKIRKVLFNEVTAVVALLSIAIGVMNWVRNPQQSNDLAIRLQEERISAQRTTIDNLTKTQQNDTQEVKLELVNLKDEVSDLKINIKALEVIINERIPVKK